nr:unnamed protein product [Callosobruchus chinensis]
MNTLLEPSADASGICPNEVLPHLVDAGHTADHTKPDEFLFGRDFEEKFRAAKKLVKIWALLIFPERHPPCKKEEGGQQHAPSASLVSRPESDLTRKRPVHQRREMKPFRGQQRPSPECSNQEVHQAKQGPLEVSSSAQLAGRLSGFYTAWSNIADNPTILSWVTGYEIPLVCVPYRREIPYNYSFPPKELQLMRKAIAELMDMGAVVHCAPVEGQYLSKIFLTDKANGTKRFILNLKQLNNYVQYFHLKWKTIEQPLS